MRAPPKGNVQFLFNFDVYFGCVCILEKVARALWPHFGSNFFVRQQKQVKVGRVVSEFQTFFQS